MRYAQRKRDGAQLAIKYQDCDIAEGSGDVQRLLLCAAEAELFGACSIACHQQGLPGSDGHTLLSAGALATPFEWGFYVDPKDIQRIVMWQAMPFAGMYTLHRWMHHNMQVQICSVSQHSNSEQKKCTLHDIIARTQACPRMPAANTLF